MKKRHESALFLVFLDRTCRDKCLKLGLPAVVVYFRNIIAVVAQDGEIFVHTQTRMGSDVDDVDTDVGAGAVAVRSFGRNGVQASCDNDG